MEKGNNKTKRQVLENVKSLFEDKEDYCEPIKTKGVFDNYYLKLKSNGDVNLSLAQYLNEITPYLKKMIIGFIVSNYT